MPNIRLLKEVGLIFEGTDRCHYAWTSAPVKNPMVPGKQARYSVASPQAAAHEQGNEWKKQHDHTASPKILLNDNFPS